jgi:hypothetical protein
MAAETERDTGPPTEVREEETVADPEVAFKRLADLTRRVMDVPKSEVPRVFAKPKKKRAKRKRGH